MLAVRSLTLLRLDPGCYLPIDKRSGVSSMTLEVIKCRPIAMNEELE